MKRETEEKLNYKLLVEGKDDQSVIWGLAAKFNLTENYEVIDCGNYERVIESLPVRIKSSNVKVIGIIVDADDNLANKWESIKQSLSKLDYQLPAKIPIGGLIIANSKLFDVKVGVWIMPNNDINGKIEDFIKFLIPKKDCLSEIAENALENIESKNLNKYKPKDKAKAFIHTWLAWQEKPGNRMGTAITANYFNLDVEECNKFISWLKLLFNKQEKE